MRLLNLNNVDEIRTEGHDVVLQFSGGYVGRLVQHNMAGVNQALARIRTALDDNGWIEVDR